MDQFEEAQKRFLQRLVCFVIHVCWDGFLCFIVDALKVCQHRLYQSVHALVCFQNQVLVVFFCDVDSAYRLDFSKYLEL
jgi:hypothetical protein